MTGIVDLIARVRGEAPAPSTQRGLAGGAVELSFS
jgi:hypothetical protein